MTDREFMRHIVATVAYRAAKTIRDSPGTFADFLPPNAGNTPRRIVAHLGDLYDWALSMVRGERKWRSNEPLPWSEECARFFRSLRAFDDFLASGAPVEYDLTLLFQGPIADSLTHVGQLAMLRRLHGAPMRGENYTRSAIEIGRVGPDQTPPNPKYEFD